MVPDGRMSGTHRQVHRALRGVASLFDTGMASARRFPQWPKQAFTHEPAEEYRPKSVRLLWIAERPVREAAVAAATPDVLRQPWRSKRGLAVSVIRPPA